jgi:hypothetical protein
MYRVLAANAEVRERRNQLRHPAYHKPELLATGPNQVWSWDITKLLGPVKWTYYSLYVLLDIFSRYVVGWLLARQEAAALAKGLIAESCERQHIGPDQLIIHVDRGPSMTSQPVALLLATLGVVPSHSRPHVSDDNPFSEAQFKTLKYRPDFPARFGAYEDAETFCRRFFPWYNLEHRHGALGLMTPHDIHYGLGEAKWQQRVAVLRTAYAAHPERFPRGVPVPPPLPTAAWINKPPAAPALGHVPVEHASAARDLVDGQREVRLQAAQGFADTVAGDAPADGVQLDGKPVHGLPCAGGVTAEPEARCPSSAFRSRQGHPLQIVEAAPTAAPRGPSWRRPGRGRSPVSSRPARGPSAPSPCRRAARRPCPDGTRPAGCREACRRCPRGG